MKKGLLIFVLLATTIAYSMDQEEGKISQVLYTFDLVTIEKLCKQGKIDFKKKYCTFSDEKKYCTFSERQFCISPLGETPFDFAVCRNNLELADLFIRYGAEPDMETYSNLCRWGSYQFLPILYKYHPNVEGQGARGNLLHRAVDCCIPENVYKLIAGILLFFPSYCEQKSWFGEYFFIQRFRTRPLGSQIQEITEPQNFTPLEYAKSGGLGYHPHLSSAQKAIEILEDKKLLEQTMNEVAGEFKLLAIKNVGIDLYVQGRELGMSVGEMHEQRSFLQRNNQQNSKEEEE